MKMMILCVTALMLFVSVSDLRAGIQLRTEAFYALPADSANRLVLKRNLFNINTDLTLTQELSSAAKFYFQHQMLGLFKSLALPEMRIPNMNTVATGMTIDGFGTTDLNVSSTFFKYAQPLTPPFLKPEWQMRSEMVSVAAGHWMIDKSRFFADASASYFILNYNLAQRIQDTSNQDFKDSLFRDQKDADLWYGMSVGVKLPASLSLTAGSVLKNDMSGIGGYDIHEHRLTLAGDHEIVETKAYIGWKITGRFRKSEIIHWKGYADGLVSEVSLRPMFKVSRAFYLKGDAQIEVGKNLQKQYYELMVRRSKLVGYQSDLGLFASLGGLFPRTGFYGNAQLPLTKKVSLTPATGAYWKYSPVSGKYLWYRLDGGLNLTWTAFQNTELYGGGRYCFVKEADPFKTRFDLFVGFQRW